MGNYTSWHVGMKVVFVGYPETARTFHGDREIKRKQWLEIGEVRTILAIAVRERYANSRWAGPSIYVGCDDPQYGPVWHHCSGFRPVQPRKTDISIFTAMLNTQPVSRPRNKPVQHDIFGDA